MFQENIPLAQYSHYKIGGPARYFYIARTVEEIIGAAAKIRGEGLPLFVLAGGTNILFNDEGLDGLVLKPELMTLEEKGNTRVRVGAGVAMPALLDYTIERSLSGLEWAGGLPGTLGGAIRGNAGAFGGEIKDVIQEVISLDITREKPKLIRRQGPECRFAYRNSVFKEINLNPLPNAPQRHPETREIILEAILQLKKGRPGAIKRQIEEKIAYRKEHHPLEHPNIGSIFKNVELAKHPHLDKEKFAPVVKQDPFPVIPTAYLLDQAGLKGKKEGEAMVSEKHPNFIVNLGQAKAQEVKDLITLVKTTIREQFAIELEEEVIIL